MSLLRTFSSACRSVLMASSLASGGASAPTAAAFSAPMIPRPLLAPGPAAAAVAAIQSRGMKVVGMPRRRCKHCWKEVIDERMYVFCNVHRRHRQKERFAPIKTQYIMTHATNGASSKGNGTGRRGMWTQSLFRLDF